MQTITVGACSQANINPKNQKAPPMTNRTHHVFFSYARADNGEANNHFVTRFHDLLCKEHQAVTGRELKTFFDTGAIDSVEHCKTQFGPRPPSHSTVPDTSQ